MVILWPRYSTRASGDLSATLRPEKPIRAWVPSQNGFLADPPQRHSAITVFVGMVSPREFSSARIPLTRYGPFSATSMEGFFAS
jgi:hypothetical protein